MYSTMILIEGPVICVDAGDVAVVVGGLLPHTDHLVTAADASVHHDLLQENQLVIPEITFFFEARNII